MKRIVSIFLVLTLMLSLAACGAHESEAAESESPTNPPVAEETSQSKTLAVSMTDDMPADEYERAVWYGFLPEDLATADPDATTVTWAQYCGMLGRMIKSYEEGAYPAWEEMTINAPDTGMKRDGAMVSLLFAAKVMGLAAFNAQPPAAFDTYADSVWDNVTMDYPVFDWNTAIDLGEGCVDNNHVGPSYDFCLRRISVRSGKSLLEFNENDDLCLEQPLTLREAVLSAIRLYESEYGAFISAVSSETLKLAGKMPAAAYNNLPRWHGHTVPPRMWWYGPETQETYMEDEISLYASFGFNFLRAPLLCEELFLDGDVSQPNRAAFNRLDELLEYAAKYGIHICMDLHTMPGFTTNETDDDDILFSDQATQELFADIWQTIAAYFRDIPSNLLSFNLLNEPHPHTDEVLTDEVYAAVMQKAIDAIREQSPERLIIASGAGVSWAEPCEGLANAKIAQGTSVYFLNEGADMWPLYYINKNMNAAEGELTLKGDFPAGTTLTVSVMQYSGGSYTLFADNTRIAEFD
ncbi:MAG: cellulase family glycosylhydrolase, partial [Eubacteriales bacterium]|nr:cellulase family glycosylhydrolase [Eubacteriales bacterium]